MKLSSLKYVFIVLLSSFIGIIANPELPFASDSVVITNLNEDKIVETVLPELPAETPDSNGQNVEPANTVANETSTGEVANEVAYEEPTPAESYEETYEEPYSEEVYYAPANNISINGRTIDLAYTDNTGEDAGGTALAWYYKTGKFIYGHNSWNVFGFLDSAYDGGWLLGMTFSVTMDGVTSYYTVENYRLYDYDASQPKYLWYNGESTKMNPIVKASLNGTSYRMAIMTCYAGSSKRLVIFAN